MSFNLLWPSDAIWRHGTRSTLAQVMACSLTAPSHYLNQCWLIISEVPWHSSQGIIIGQCEDINQQNKIENCSFKMASRFPRGQWVNLQSASWMCHSVDLAVDRLIWQWTVTPCDLSSLLDSNCISLKSQHSLESNGSMNYNPHSVQNFI